MNFGDDEYSAFEIPAAFDPQCTVGEPVSIVKPDVHNPEFAHASSVVKLFRDKKQRLADVMDEIAATQQIIDSGLSEFDDVKARVHALLLKFPSDNPVDFDHLKARIDAMLDEKRAHLQRIQPERDVLVRELAAMTSGMAEMSSVLSAVLSNNADIVSKCSVCYENRVNVVLLNCGHVFCDTCSARFSEQFYGCPACRQPIVRIQKLFF